MTDTSSAGALEAHRLLKAFVERLCKLHACRPIKDIYQGDTDLWQAAISDSGISGLQIACCLLQVVEGARYTCRISPSVSVDHRIDAAFWKGEMSGNILTTRKTARSVPVIRISLRLDPGVLILQKAQQNAVRPRRIVVAVAPSVVATHMAPA